MRMMLLRSIGFSRTAEVDLLRSDKYSSLIFSILIHRILDSRLSRHAVSNRLASGLGLPLRNSFVDSAMPIVKRFGTNVFSRWGMDARLARISSATLASSAARNLRLRSSITSSGICPQMHLTGQGKYWIQPARIAYSALQIVVSLTKQS